MNYYLPIERDNFDIKKVNFDGNFSWKGMLFCGRVFVRKGILLSACCNWQMISYDGFSRCLCGDVGFFLKLFWAFKFVFFCFGYYLVRSLIGGSFLIIFFLDLLF